jgi:hypothetical protein
VIVPVLEVKIDVSIFVIPGIWKGCQVLEICQQKLSTTILGKRLVKLELYFL